jgi:hypothetical protein
MSQEDCAREARRIIAGVFVGDYDPSDHALDMAQRAIDRLRSAGFRVESVAETA